MKDNLRLLAWILDTREFLPLNGIDLSNKRVQTNNGDFAFEEVLLLSSTTMFDKNNVEIFEGFVCQIERPCVLATGFIKMIQGCYVFEEFETKNILRLCDLNFNRYEIKVENYLYVEKEGTTIKLSKEVLSSLKPY